MASNRFSNRSKTTGKFERVDVSNTPLAADSKFPTFSKDGFEVSSPSDVQDSPYELVPGDQNVVRRPVAPRVEDNLGTGSPLRARRPTMVHPEEEAKEQYGVHNAILRTAARHSGPMDPSSFLASGR